MHGRPLQKGKRKTREGSRKGKKTKGKEILQNTLGGRSCDIISKGDNYHCEGRDEAGDRTRD